ncbi:MAG: hypothetical protein Q7R97_01140 [Candidatus Daviesbacteria bacterium]|nr:hypothetical protein [Candidatus Daviesbacteria bacterium]
MIQLLETILKTCFTKHQALRKLEEAREQWEKDTFRYEIASSPASPDPRNDTSISVYPEPACNEPVEPVEGLSADVIAILSLSKGKQSLLNFDQLESELKTMESLVIFTAFPLPEEQIPILGNFVRKTFPAIKFIDLKVDPALAGGASLGWKGEFRDYSLRLKMRLVLSTKGGSNNIDIVRGVRHLPEEHL